MTRPARTPFPCSSAVLFAAGLLLAACGGGGGAPAPPEDTSEPLYFEPIGMGPQARLADSTAVERVIRDAETWAAYTDSLRPVAPFKEVDFTQAMVLLAAVPQTTSGYSIAFASVEQTDSVVVATYTLNEPDTDCLMAATPTVPFGAVLVRRAEGPVRFVRQRESYRCTFGPRR